MAFYNFDVFYFSLFFLFYFLQGNEVPEGPGRGHQDHSDGYHGAPQGTGTRHGPSEEVAAPTHRSSVADWNHGELTMSLIDPVVML